MIYSEWFHELNQPIQIGLVYECSWTLIVFMDSHKWTEKKQG